MRLRIVLAVIVVMGLCALGLGVGAVLFLHPDLLPIASSSLQAQPGDTVVNLSWQPMAGARGYFVFRDISAVPLNPTPIADTSFQDIGLTNGRTYTYAVAPTYQDGQTGSRSASIKVAPKSR